LKINRNLERLTLHNTKLNDQSFHHLLENFPWKLKKLDISRNSDLTLKSYKTLFKHFVDTKAKISHINLEGNEIGDDIVKELCDMMMYFRGI
jgi:hypothetical protein